MALNDKVRLIPNGHKLICGEADIDIDDVMALRAGEMVMVLVSTTYTIVMGSIRELNAGEQSHVHQFFNRSIHRRPPYAWLICPHGLP